jgi:ribonuclease HII
MSLNPDLSEEMELHSRGHRLIAGLDEAGRGSWAGPVVAGAVILPLDRPLLDKDLEGVRDSKRLTAKRREHLYEVIEGIALALGVGIVTPDVIDEVGIVPATRQAMLEAVLKLPVKPDFLLIDFLSIPSLSIPQKAIKGGDEKSLSIAAASIVAKVRRDRLMAELDEIYPGYGFARNKGYGTAFHREALLSLGPSPIHRFSFRVIKTLESPQPAEVSSF